MGNHISFHSTIKIIHYNGLIQKFDQPLTVAELMLEHPKHVVVDFHSALNQKRPTPLPADKNLDMNKTYVMVPVKPGKPVGLSVEECRRVLSIVESSMNSDYFMCSQGFLPWLVRFLKKKSVVIGEGETTLKIMEEERFDFCEFLPEMMEERAEYMSKQLSGKGWKPCLDTIKENKVKKNLPSWLFLTTFTATNI
ncbi:uncharacterized protein [Cicer arietinum]|uniref:Uncharacterized protein LOC101498153 n=1 Tax=Cicer arietinum TaxID=3827 RepID=A0A1S2XTS1_CICAR|nr:uncharacterized protein LOC101498153 [Cicer arietinum]